MSDAVLISRYLSRKLRHIHVLLTNYKTEGSRFCFSVLTRQTEWTNRKQRTLMVIKTKRKKIRVAIKNCSKRFKYSIICGASWLCLLHCSVVQNPKIPYLPVQRKKPETL